MTGKKSTKMKSRPHVWVLTSGETGMVNQAVGLAEASGYSYENKIVTLRRRYRIFPGDMVAKIAGAESVIDGHKILAPPFPDIIIACGRRSIAAALAVKQQAPDKIFLVYIHRPRLNLELFDMVVPSYHDAITGAHVYPTGPSLHRVTDEVLHNAKKQWAFAEISRPMLGVLIGGNRRTHRMKLALADRAGRQLLGLSKKFGIVLSFSRRTPFAAWVGFMRALNNRGNIYVWDGLGDNPYFGILAQSDALLVSAESVSMISEALFTGKPVYLLELPGNSKRFDYFHNWLYQNDYCRPFAGKVELGWGKSIDDSRRIAAILREQYREFTAKSFA